MLISHSYVNVDQWVTHVKIKHDRNPMKMHKSMDRLQGNYLRAAAPAADPGRSGNESNQMGTNILRCFALSGLLNEANHRKPPQYKTMISVFGI